MTGSQAQAKRQTSVLTAAVLTAGAAAAMVAVPSSASAATSHTTFTGHCSIVGTDTAHNHGSFFRGQGTCFGSLNGGPVVAHHAVEVIREHGLITPSYFGLPAVHGASHGIGTITFGHDAAAPVLRFAIQRSGSSFTAEGVQDGMGSGSTTMTHDGFLRVSMTTTSGTMCD